ncbi:MAG: hypothetical protein ABIP06_11400 [Pyrinomonadaceae bacterium]
MRKLAFLPLLMLFVLGVCSQNLPTGANERETPKFYRGDEKFAAAFEPYRAHFVFENQVAGFDLFSLNMATKIVETESGWEDTFSIFLPFRNESLQVLRIISEIDQKTALLKKITYKYSENTDEYVFDDAKITLSQQQNGKIKQFVFDNREKIYPCSYSTAFYALLPLEENFSASFACFIPETGGKPKLSFHKMTFKVVKTESILTVQGTFECYKLESRSDRIADPSDKKPSAKNEKLADMSVKNLQKANFGTVWIDKKTHKLIKAEVDSKMGAVSIIIGK